MPAEHELRPGEWVEFAQDVMIDNARSTRTTVDKKTGAGPREGRIDKLEEIILETRSRLNLALARTHGRHALAVGDQDSLYEGAGHAALPFASPSTALDAGIKRIISKLVATGRTDEQILAHISLIGTGVTAEHIRSCRAASQTDSNSGSVSSGLDSSLATSVSEIRAGSSSPVVTGNILSSKDLASADPHMWGRLHLSPAAPPGPTSAFPTPLAGFARSPQMEPLYRRSPQMEPLYRSPSPGCSPRPSPKTQGRDYEATVHAPRLEEKDDRKVKSKVEETCRDAISKPQAALPTFPLEKDDDGMMESKVETSRDVQMSQLQNDAPAEGGRAHAETGLETAEAEAAAAGGGAGPRKPEPPKTAPEPANKFDLTSFPNTVSDAEVLKEMLFLESDDQWNPPAKRRFAWLYELLQMLFLLCMCLSFVFIESWAFSAFFGPDEEAGVTQEGNAFAQIAAYAASGAAATVEMTAQLTHDTSSGGQELLGRLAGAIKLQGLIGEAAQQKHETADGRVTAGEKEAAALTRQLKEMHKDVKSTYDRAEAAGEAQEKGLLALKEKLGEAQAEASKANERADAETKRTVELNALLQKMQSEAEAARETQAKELSALREKLGEAQAEASKANERADAETKRTVELNALMQKMQSEAEMVREDCRARASSVQVGDGIPGGVGPSGEREDGDPDWEGDAEMFHECAWEVLALRHKVTELEKADQQSAVTCEKQLAKTVNAVMRGERRKRSKSIAHKMLITLAPFLSARKRPRSTGVHVKVRKTDQAP